MSVSWWAAQIKCSKLWKVKTENCEQFKTANCEQLTTAKLTRAAAASQQQQQQQQLSVVCCCCCCCWPSGCSLGWSMPFCALCLPLVCSTCFLCVSPLSLTLFLSLCLSLCFCYFGASSISRMRSAKTKLTVHICVFRICFALWFLTRFRDVLICTGNWSTHAQHARGNERKGEQQAAGSRQHAI